MYKLNQKYKPFQIDEDQEMWFAEINYYGDITLYNDYDHQDCIEVRASTEIILNHRVSKILEALNGE